DLIIGEGPAARSVKIDLSPFTLIGATTRAGLLTTPLRDSFGIPVRLNFYSEKELEEIVNRGARVLGIGIAPDGANEVARRARGTPRIAGLLLRAPRVRPALPRRCCDACGTSRTLRVAKQSTARPPTVHCPPSRSMLWVSMQWTAATSRQSHKITVAGRWASIRWQRHSPSPVMRSRTLSSRF